MSLNYYIRGKTNEEIKFERIEKYEKEQELKEFEKLERKKERKKEREREKTKEKDIKKKIYEIATEIDVYGIKQIKEDFEKETMWMSNKEILTWLEEKIGHEKLEQQQQLRDQYKLETGKNFMTLKNTIRYDYFHWKTKKTKENNRKRELEELERLKPIPEAVKNDIKLKKAKKLTDKEKKQLIMEEMKQGIQMVINEELDDIDDDIEKVEKILEELDNKKLDAINLQDAIEEKELREQYKLETGKDALTLNKKIRKSYLKWKIEQ